MSVPAKLPNSRAQNPEYFKAYYEKNREKYLKKNLTFYQKHKERLKGVAKIRNYRTMIISLLMERDGENCGICGKSLVDAKVEIDHIVPVCAGGLSTSDNLQLSHKICNRKKPKGRRGYPINK